MSQDMKNLIRNIVILFGVIIFAHLFAIQAITLYDKFIDIGSSWIDLSYFLGYPLSYIFFLTLLFTAFGARNKYWWIGILLIPAALVEIYLDLPHIYIPIALALLGWLIGFGIAKFSEFIWQR